MILHSGIFNFKTDVSKEEKVSFFSALKSLEFIAGVMNMEIAKQTSAKNKFDFAFSMHFLNANDYAAYSIHPQHDAFVQNYWLKYVEDFMEIDTEPLQITQ
jgi:Stress responsive A/B Barrel Domain